MLKATGDSACAPTADQVVLLVTTQIKVACANRSSVQFLEAGKVAKLKKGEILMVARLD